jgi:hypothetical protein
MNRIELESKSNEEKEERKRRLDEILERRKKKKEREKKAKEAGERKEVGVVAQLSDYQPADIRIEIVPHPDYVSGMTSTPRNNPLEDSSLSADVEDT